MQDHNAVAARAFLYKFFPDKTRKLRNAAHGGYAGKLSDRFRGRKSHKRSEPSGHPLLARQVLFCFEQLPTLLFAATELPFIQGHECATRKNNF